MTIGPPKLPILPPLLPDRLGVTTTGVKASGLEAPFFLPWDKVATDQVKEFGQKAAGLAEMRRQGLAVPPFAVIPSSQVRRLLAGQVDPASFERAIEEIIRFLEQDPEVKRRHLRFGDPKRPLLIAIRSGGEQVMSGVLDTLLRCGLTPSTAVGLGLSFDDPFNAQRAFLRYTIDYGVIAHSIPREKYRVIGEPKDDIRALKKQIKRGLKIFTRETENPFPRDAWRQISNAILGVARSWDEPHAVDYRRRYGIGDDSPSPIIVQPHVWGDLGKGSLAGIIYTRDPVTGERVVTGDIKRKAAGNLVMTGGGPKARPFSDLALLNPPPYGAIKEIAAQVEGIFNGPRELEVTVEGGKAYLLQAAPLPASPLAKVRIAVDLHREGKIDLREVRRQVGDKVLEDLQSPTFSLPGKELLMGKTVIPGIGAGPLALLDYREGQVEPPNRPSVMMVFGYPPPMLWEGLFDRAAAFVFYEKPPAHFVSRLSRLEGRRVPVISNLQEQLEVLQNGFLRVGTDEGQQVVRPGEVLSVKASQQDAIVVLGRLKRVRSRLGRFIRGEIPFEELGRRTREPARVVQEYLRLMGGLKEEELAEEVKTVAQGLLQGPELELHRVAEAVLSRKWGRERWDRGAEQSTYDFGPRVGQLMTELHRDSEGRLLKAFLAAYYMQHSLAVALFSALLSSLQGVFLDAYVRKALETDHDPGWRSGVFLLSRMVADLNKNYERGRGIVDHLQTETLRFLIQELHLLYTSRSQPKDTAELAELIGILNRFPRLEEGQMKEFLRGLSEKTIQRILNDSELDLRLREWFQTFLQP